MTPAEALEAARTAEPAPYADHDPADPLGLAPGAPVQVMADDYGREPIDGTLVAANARRVVRGARGPGARPPATSTSRASATSWWRR